MYKSLFHPRGYPLKDEYVAQNYAQIFPSSPVFIHIYTVIHNGKTGIGDVDNWTEAPTGIDVDVVLTTASISKGDVFGSGIKKNL